MKILEFELDDFQGIKHLHMKEPPDIVILIGLNGSGKSSILKALYNGLRFCFGYDQEMKSGIRLVIDLSDHFNEIKDKFKDSTFQDNNSHIIAQRMASLSSTKRKMLKSHLTELLKNFISSKIDNFDGFILEFTGGDIKLDADIELENDTMYELIKDLQPKKELNFWFGLFLHEWLKTRQKGNPHTPGVVYFDSEKNIVRNTQIQPANLPETDSQRIGSLADQQWRIDTLGQRLINLVLAYVQQKNMSPESDPPDPITRINDSLQSFTPHLKIISPLSRYNKLRFNVRGIELPFEDLSSGEIALINFAIDYLEVEVNRGVLIIDEPSVFLHYDLQNRLISFIKQLSTLEADGIEYSPQIWVATHSPPIIHSVPEDSIYVTDIGNAEQASYPLKDIEGSRQKRQMLTLLGVSHYFDRRPVLFVEGPSDIDYLTRIFSKFKPELIEKWRLHKVEGINTSEEMRSHLDELRTIAEKVSAKELSLQLWQNYFLLDGNNERSQSDEVDTFIWNFYHIENLLFQDPWFHHLERIMQIRQNIDIDLQAALESAIEITYQKMDPPLSESHNDLLENGTWKSKLPGRKLFGIWKDNQKMARFSTKVAFNKLVDYTTSVDELPEELKRLLNWLDEKYDVWLDFI